MITKYRPSLSLAELEYILDVLKSSPPAPLKSNVERTLRAFVMKARYNILAPAYVTSSPESLEQKLGFKPPADSDPDVTLYSIWVNHPSSLTKVQLDRVVLYRYTNDLMTPEEEYQYEQMIEHGDKI